jgi:hypothetical protein
MSEQIDQFADSLGERLTTIEKVIDEAKIGLTTLIEAFAMACLDRRNRLQHQGTTDGNSQNYFARRLQSPGLRHSGNGLLREGNSCVKGFPSR